MIVFLKKLLLFCLFFSVLNYTFDYFYSKKERQSIAEKKHNKYLKWSDINCINKKYDVIFLGSSRCYCAYNPVIFDSLLKSKSYNMCTGSQNLIESYYVLKEVLKYQKPKIVIYELYQGTFEKNFDFSHVIGNSMFMSWSGKIDMLINGFGFAGILNYFLPVLRNKNYIKYDINNLLNQKGLDIDMKNETGRWIKGFHLNNSVVENRDVENFSPIGGYDDVINDKKFIYFFSKLILLCQSNNIKLICSTAPYPPSRIKISNHYSKKNAFYILCKRYSIPYYDLNFVDGGSLKYFDRDFADHHHINNTGATKASIQLANTLRNSKLE